MKRPTVTPVLAVLITALLTGSLFGEVPPPRATHPCGQEQAGYWVVPHLDGEGGCRLVVEPYFPLPGDILLYDNFSNFLRIGFKLVGSGTPIHSAIIIARPEGTPAILEVGAHTRPRAFTETSVVEVLPRLAEYPGAIMVRRPYQPLTPEQSEALTCFALAQQGKKFALGRLLLQATPVRCRSGLRYYLFAKTNLERDRWICSEAVVAAGTVAGLLDGDRHRANAMYPRDLAYDEKFDLSHCYNPPILWVADPNPRINGNQVNSPLQRER